MSRTIICALVVLLASGVSCHRVLSGNDDEAPPATPKVLEAVVVVPTFKPRHQLVDLAGATWRKGLMAFVATNGSEEKQIEIPHDVYAWGEEEWYEYPDEKVKSGSGLNPGAKRYLAAVRLANRSFAGRFDWLIVGDDDVIFLLDNLRDILKNVNPNIPFLITDDLGGCCHNNCTQDTQSCSLPGQDAGRGEKDCVRHPPVAPCLRTTLETGSCPAPSGSKMWFGGGRGAIISKGLINSIPEAAWKNCEEKLTGGGGERVAKCIWENGYGPTNPTVATAPAARPFSTCLFGRYSPVTWITTLNAVNGRRGQCDSSCQDVVKGVSIHLALDNGAADEASVELARHEMLDITAAYRRARHAMWMAARPKKGRKP